QRMRLEGPFRLGGHACIGPLLAVERVNAGPANIEFAVVATHGVRKTPLRSAFGKDFGRPPTVFAFLNEAAPGVRTAANVQFALVAGGAIQRPVSARLAAVQPRRSARVSIDTPRLVRTCLHASPIVGRGNRVEVALMDDQRPNARRLTRPDLPAIGPAILSFVAKDVAPVPLVLRIDRSRVQLPLKDGQRIADVIAGATGTAAIHPAAHPGVVDSKTNVSIGSLRLIPSGAGLER